MKIFKKLAAVLSAAVIAASACASVAVTAGADSIYDTATAISSGKSVVTTILSGKTVDYKVNVSKSGELKLNIESHMRTGYVQVFDENGKSLASVDATVTSGGCSSIGSTEHLLRWNETVEKFKGTVSYSVNRGTYYIRFQRNDSGCLRCSCSGKLSFTATFPTNTTTAKLNYITISMNRGDSLSLGADMTGTGEVTWKSSKPSIASISSSGKVTAKAKGTTVISAKFGKTTKKIKIKVS